MALLVSKNQWQSNHLVVSNDEGVSHVGVITLTGEKKLEEKVIEINFDLCLMLTVFIDPLAAKKAKICPSNEDW